MKIPKGPGRNPHKRDMITKYIKKRILSGSWDHGDRIPARTFLERRFSASSVTVQQALDLLVSEGFVRVEGRRGTFVNEILPCQVNYALIFPDRPSKDDRRNAYFAVMDGEAKKLQKQLPGKMISYYHIDKTRTESFYQLVEDIQESRLAGLIFATSPHELVKTPILDYPGIPRVAFTSSRKYGMPVIRMGVGNFLRMSIDYLREQGCERIALIDTAGYGGSASFADELKSKADTLPEWHQTVTLLYPQAAGQVTRLLMSPNNQKRPDGLIITDDNLTPFVQEALIEAKVRVPEELCLVSHCNFPSEIAPNPPVKLIGIPTCEGLQLAVQLIDAMRVGRDVPERSEIPLTSDS